jgi:thioredoxin reductase (NADPH)
MSQENQQVQNVIILGSGPAGLTAAIYASRANLKPLLIDGVQPGGQLMITTDVENYPGFPHSVMGPALMDSFRNQASKFGTEFIYGQATDVDFSNRPFRVKIDEKKELKAKTVIIATGAKANLLGLESESKYMGFGVSACATCDGFFFQNKNVMVVGGGDSALEEAIFLTKFASSVTIIHRREEFRASKIIIDRAKANAKIDYILNSTIEEFLGDGQKLTGVRLANKINGKVSEVLCEGVFIAIGHSPNTSVFKDQVNMDASGYILTENGTTQTSVPGVFACGDVQDSSYRQAVTAAGTGCMSAIDAERFLQETDS